MQPFEDDKKYLPRYLELLKKSKAAWVAKGKPRITLESIIEEAMHDEKVLAETGKYPSRENLSPFDLSDEELMELAHLDAKFNPNFELDRMLLGPTYMTSEGEKGTWFSIRRRHLEIVNGSEPIVCPNSVPQIPDSKMRELTQWLKGQKLVADDSTLLWVGDQDKPNSYCLCLNLKEPNFCTQLQQKQRTVAENMSKAMLEPTPTTSESLDKEIHAIATIGKWHKEGKTWTEEDVATAIGVDRRTLYKWELYQKAKQALKIDGTRPPKGSKSDGIVDAEFENDD